MLSSSFEPHQKKASAIFTRLYTKKNNGANSSLFHKEPNVVCAKTFLVTEEELVTSEEDEAQADREEVPWRLEPR